MSENDVKGVEALLGRYLDAYRGRNINALAEVVAKDPNLVAYGTDEGEVWYGWESFRNVTEKIFLAVKEIEWKRGRTRVNFSQDGSVAWFAEEISGNFLAAGKRIACDFRFTGVAEKRGDKWMLVQFHRSVPVKEYAVPYLETHGVRFD